MSLEEELEKIISELKSVKIETGIEDYDDLIKSYLQCAIYDLENAIGNAFYAKQEQTEVLDG